jgi:hypothetical protein
MSFLRRLFGGGSVAGRDRALHLYVKCNRCGSPVHVRVDLNNDLSINYGEGEQAEGYTLVKEVMDDRCFRLMHAEVHFDSQKRETGRQIEGGSFISQEEYDQLRDQPAKSRT